MSFWAKVFKRLRAKKKALVIEGGGMRGIFLVGILQAFADHAYFPFDLIIGTSAGALVGCAYAARQIHIARDSFFGKLLSGRFIQVSNIFNSERHIIDLDWMIDAIVRGTEPLDVAALKKSCPVLITATNCPYDRAPETIYLNSHKDDIFESLKATAALPFLYRGFVNYKGYMLLDGGVTDPIPFYKALEAGYKDILVITTRPQGYRKKQDSFWIRTLYEHYYKEPELRYLVKSMENLYEKYNRILDDMENLRKSKDIEVIYPPEDFSVERLTTEPKKLLEGFEQGIAAGNAYMQNAKIF